MILYLADKNGLDEVNVKEIKDGIYILDENKGGKGTLLETELYTYIRDAKDKTNMYIFGQDMVKVVDIWNDYVEDIKNLINSFKNLSKSLNREGKIIDIFLLVFAFIFLIITISRVLL